MIKEILDKKFGASWHVVVGEGFGFELSYEVNKLFYMFFAGSLAVCVWKCSWYKIFYISKNNHFNKKGEIQWIHKNHTLPDSNPTFPDLQNKILYLNSTIYVK